MSILVTGVNGQDGRIIHNHYKATGEKVFGIARNQLMYPDDDGFRIEPLDISDHVSFSEFLSYAKPKRIFHLAASHANSLDMQLHGQKAELEMYSVHVEASKIILEWQRENHTIESKLVVALSSQMFSSNQDKTWIDESTPLSPSTKYGQTKSQAYELVREYRAKYKVHASGAILFNHSSRFSKPNFVLVEIANQIVEVLLGKTSVIVLRNFDVELDISHADDICKAMIEMLNLEAPEDFVLASGTTTNLKNLTLDCLRHYNVCKKIELISTHPIQTSQKVLIGNPKKATLRMDWVPTTDVLGILVSITESLLQSSSNA